MHARAVTTTPFSKPIGAGHLAASPAGTVVRLLFVIEAVGGSSPAEIVTAFLQALADGDAEAAIAFVADDLIYNNVSLPTIRGKKRFARAARLYLWGATSGSGR